MQAGERKVVVQFRSKHKNALKARKVHSLQPQRLHSDNEKDMRQQTIHGKWGVKVQVVALTNKKSPSPHVTGN